MTAITPPWDYLIVTASNADQAKAYNDQLDLRRRLGLLAGVREVIVVADPGGKRVGSGGSTVFCLMEVLRRRLGGRKDLGDPSTWLETLKGLRILIIHAGGDSRRLPAYGPCGKVFVPVPGESDSAISETIFDRQFPIYLTLSPVPAGRGQIVVTAGDALLGFDPSVVRFTGEGITGLGCLAPPDRASRHGVYCADAGGAVRLFLQKPTFQQQENAGAINRYGQSILDIGVMSLDAATAVVLLRLGGLAAEGGELKLTGAISSAIEEHGMDLYLEVCCAMGSGATLEQYLASVRGGGCAWGQELLKQTFETLWPVPFAVQILPRCRFLHFGTTRQIISSGEELLREDRGLAQLDIPLSINNHFHGDGSVIGSHSWVEGCRIAAPLHLAGENVVVGVDVNEELSLPAGACLDIVQGATVPGAARGSFDATVSATTSRIPSRKERLSATCRWGSGSKRSAPRPPMCGTPPATRADAVSGTPGCFRLRASPTVSAAGYGCSPPPQPAKPRRDSGGRLTATACPR